MPVLIGSPKPRSVWRVVDIQGRQPQCATELMQHLCSGSSKDLAFIIFLSHSLISFSREKLSAVPTMENILEVYGAAVSCIDYLFSATGITPAQFCQSFYGISAALIIGINILPKTASSALMDYGARRSDAGNSGSSLVRKLMDWTQVPHSWFLHYYLFSFSLSLFWAGQYFFRGEIMRVLASRQAEAGGRSMDVSQVVVVLGLMGLQGGRRLYESLVVTKPGKTPMGAAHWIVGLAYYGVMSVTVWIEGSGAILEAWDTGKARMNIPMRTPLMVGLFFSAWIKQHECHKYLANLKKYTLPQEGYFESVVCAHYMFECIIYVSMALVAAPPGSVFNRTILVGTVFVVVNLGITADGTKRWYGEKFGVDKVANKSRMIPFVY